MREALERLDQAIDRLESRLAHTAETTPAPPFVKPPLNATVAERLDTIIARIEAALVE